MSKPSPSQFILPPGILIALLATGGFFFLGFFLPVIVAVLKGAPEPDPRPVRFADQSDLQEYHAEREKLYPKGPSYTTVQHGEKLYATYCMACHQEEGVGKVGFAPYIRNQDFLALASDEFLRSTILAGRPGTAMTPWSHLSEKEIEAIIAYLRKIESPRSRQLASVDPSKKFHGDAAIGEKHYQVYCASCHGVNGTGYTEGGSGPGIGNKGFLAIASDDYIFQTVKHGRRGTPMRSFVGATGLANLEEEDVGHIIAYLRSERTPVPTANMTGTDPDPKTGQMHFNANCSACHQPDGNGRPGIAPSIRNRNFLAIASDDFIKDTIRKGRSGTAMVQRPDLSDKVIGDIIAFLRSVGTDRAPEVKVDPSLNLAGRGNATSGHQKFAVYCAACHGNEGKGYAAGGSGPAIGLEGFLSVASDDYIFQTLRHGRAGTAMRPFLGARGLANLNEQDAFDIIAYLRGLKGTSVALK